MSSNETLQACLQNQISLLELTLHDTETLAQGLDKLSIPVEHLSEPDFNDIDHYRLSPFRKVQFRFKKVPTLTHPFLQSKRGDPILYEELCTFLRDYISTNGLRNSAGLVTCDAFLKELCGRDTISFIGLLKEFNKIIQ